ncbi:hypothetical protein IWQ55_006680 [Labrenzia sp. EL_208]|nr:hypothetical protein [Labrenzia sp. EL_132]MBG6233432.1 hypothetical protein [Labrenzia sp. EL_208]
MNNSHKNARTNPLGRAEMIRRIVEEGRPFKIVATEFGLSERRTREWLKRYRMLGPAGLENRCSRPHTIANKTMAHQIGAIGRLRQDYRLPGAEIGEKLDLARSTVAGWLARLGLGRLASLEPKPPVRRYQRQNPGELLHLDIKKLGRLERTGHRITLLISLPSISSVIPCSLQSEKREPSQPENVRKILYVIEKRLVADQTSMISLSRRPAGNKS